MNNTAVVKQSALSLAEFNTETGQVLTADTVKNYLVSGNGAVTDQEILFFMELCKSRKLNPLTREVYLIKFGTSPANIVVGKEVFMKRAYRNPSFKGFKAGIAILNKDGSINYREGSMKAPQEQLIGGWCEVYLTDKEFPVRSEVSVEEYSKSQATWKQMPCVMIRKCAVVTALREAFPEDLAGMYDSAEMQNVPDKLPEKEVKVGYATAGQKQGIMKLAEMKGLYDFNNPKDISKMEDFCNSNGYCLKELKFEEVNEVLDLLSKYEPKEQVVDVDFKEVVEDPEQTTFEDTK